MDPVLLWVQQKFSEHPDVSSAETADDTDLCERAESDDPSPDLPEPVRCVDGNECDQSPEDPK